SGAGQIVSFLKHHQTDRLPPSGAIYFDHILHQIRKTLLSAFAFCTFPDCTVSQRRSAASKRFESMRFSPRGTKRMTNKIEPKKVLILYATYVTYRRHADSFAGHNR
ncbi:MAG: hypothetical protein AAGH49_02885, partial [Pseudomonadota bacterium]